MVKRFLLDKKHVAIHGLNWRCSGEFTVRCNPPKKPEAPIMVKEKPWEMGTLNWATVRMENGVMRLWYEAFDADGGMDMDSRLCYAESRDNGATWERPELGLCEFRGSKKNNIVMDRKLTHGLGLHGHSIFVDPNSPAEARYRCFFLGELPCEIGANHVTVMSYAYSADGIHWIHGAPELPVNYNMNPILHFGSDTQCVVTWDRELRRYVGYFRNLEPNGARSIGRSETQSLLDWPMPKTVLAPDFQESPVTDYYNSAATKVEDQGDSVWYAFYSVFDHDSNELHVCLATSRDGVHFDQLDRTPYIPNDRYYDKGGMYVSPGILDLGDGVQAIFYHAEVYNHGTLIHEGFDGGYCLATFPKDRLQGLDTKTAFEFTVVGKVDPLNPEVVLNADIRGRVRAALIGPDGQFIPGFTKEDCIPVTGDSLEHRIAWKGTPTDIREADLKLYAEDATLYTVTVNKA